MLPANRVDQTAGVERQFRVPPHADRKTPARPGIGDPRTGNPPCVVETLHRSLWNDCDADFIVNKAADGLEIVNPQTIADTPPQAFGTGVQMVLQGAALHEPQKREREQLLEANLASVPERVTTEEYSHQLIDPERFRFQPAEIHRIGGDADICLAGSDSPDNFGAGKLVEFYFD